MLCLLKKDFLKYTFSLLIALTILLGGIDHAIANDNNGFDPDTILYVSGANSEHSFLNGTYESNGLTYNGFTKWRNTSTTTDNYGVIILANVGGTQYSLATPAGNYSGNMCYTNAFAGDPYYCEPGTPYGLYYDAEGWGDITVSSTSPAVIYGCMDNMAVNYDPTANEDSGGCYYILPEETATSTRITNFTLSTTTNKINISYFIATTTEILLYTENRNERDGVINSAFSSTTAGLTVLTDIPITLPDPLNGAGYTYLTTKLVLASDRGVIYDWAVITADLYNNVAIGGGGTGYQPAACGLTNLGGCFINGLAVMFYPSKSVFDNFNSFVEILKTKPPAGYFYVVKNNLNSLNSTSTSAFTITIPTHIKTYLFTPFDLGIGGILWFFFAINFYKRLKHITV